MPPRSIVEGSGDGLFVSISSEDSVSFRKERKEEGGGRLAEIKEGLSQKAVLGRISQEQVR